MFKSALNYPLYTKHQMLLILETFKQYNKQYKL